MRNVIALCLLPLLAACSVQVQRSEMGLALPANWTVSGQAAPRNGTLSDWWAAFDDPELAALIRQSREGSFDIAAAAARVGQARALARMAGAAMLPRIDADISASYGKEETGRVSGGAYSTGVSAAYEVDVWGGNAAQRDAALAALAATQYGKDVVAIILFAEVGSTYFQTAALRERVKIARLNLASAERILELLHVRAAAGAATPLEVAQQSALTEAQRQALAERRQQAQDSLTALAVLLGRPPQNLVIERTDLAGLSVPAISAGVPSELIVRRPDLAKAERSLAAADADVAAARAAMLPSLTLGAGASAGSEHWSRMLHAPLYTLVAGLAAPVFDGGRLSAARDQAYARREELLADYRGAIIRALGEVEIALNAVQSAASQRRIQAKALHHARVAVELAESRYRWGAESMLAVLDVQRTLYAAQDEAVELALRQLLAGVGLFKALGGGWEGAAL